MLRQEKELQPRLLYAIDSKIVDLKTLMGMIILAIYQGIH